MASENAGALESWDWSLERKHEEFTQWCRDEENLETNLNDLQERWLHSIAKAFIPMSKYLVISIFWSSPSLLLPVTSLHIKVTRCHPWCTWNCLQNFQLFRLNNHFFLKCRASPPPPRFSMRILCCRLKPEQRVLGGLCDGHKFSLSVLFSLQGISGIVMWCLHTNY